MEKLILNFFNPIMLMLASRISMTTAMTEMENKIEAYREDPSEKNKIRLYAAATIIAQKGMIDKMEGEVNNPLAKAEMKQKNPERN